jgi:hypothetical protein
MIATPLLQWTDRMGVLHRLRRARDLSIREREQLTLLRQQMSHTVLLLEAGYHAPAISQAPPNMLRMMLRILLPTVDNEEIASFDPTTGNLLLTQWWAVTDARLPSV